jgi:hypothetical protein
MNADQNLDKHDFKGSDRLREELLMTICRPGGLFFTARHLLGFNRLSKRVHEPPSLWIEARLREPNSIMAFRDPRGSGKTTLGNISVPFWALPQPVTDPSSPVRGLDTRIADVAPKKDISSYGHIMTIRNLFDGCEVYRELTHDIVIPRRDMWSLKNGLSFHRPSAEGGPNIIPLGIDSIMTGMHPTIFMCDDLIHEHNYRNRGEIMRIKDWMIKSHNLTESEHGARFFIGNIWAIDDPQDFLRRTTLVDGKAIFADVHIWERGMEGCELCISGRQPEHKEEHHTEPMIPVLLDNKIGFDEETEEVITAPATIEDVERIKRSLDTPTLMAQYYNWPVAPGDLQFDINDIKIWDWYRMPGEGEPALAVNVSPQVYEANKGHGGRFIRTRGIPQEIIPLRNLEVYIIVDPSPSTEEAATRSRFAITVEACERVGVRQFHLDEYASNALPQVNLDQILEYWIKWWPASRKIGIESVAYQSTVKHSLIDRAREKGIFSSKLGDKHVENINRLKSEGVQIDRIRYVLMPLFASGNYYMHDTHRILRGEVSTFGIAGSKHDLLDAISNLHRIKGNKGGRSEHFVYSAVSVARERLNKANSAVSVARERLNKAN